MCCGVLLVNILAHFLNILEHHPLHRESFNTDVFHEKRKTKALHTVFRTPQHKMSTCRHKRHICWHGKNKNDCRTNKKLYHVIAKTFAVRYCADKNKRRKKLITSKRKEKKFSTANKCKYTAKC